MSATGAGAAEVGRHDAESAVERLADGVLDLLAEEDPLADYLEGHPGFGDRLADLDVDAQRRLRDRAGGSARSARELAGRCDDWVTCALAAEQAEAVVTRIEARLVEHTMVDYNVSPVGRLLGALPLVRPAGERAERDFLARLAAVPQYLRAAAERHRDGCRSGRLPVAERVQRAIVALDRALADPAGDPLRRPPLGSAHAAERDRVLEELVRPAMASYREVLRSEIAPLGRPPERPGLCWLPDGEATYAALARTHTTTGHTPEELHRIGLELGASIDDEFARLGASAFGVGEADAVKERLRTDPALCWDGPEELLAAARRTCDRAQRVAPSWFGHVPPQPCAIQPVPEAEADTAPSAYYVPAALDGSRPGTYFVNTARATQGNRCLGEVTAFHEALPGHHYQLSLAQGLAGLPKLRCLAWINAYIEGWGLYAERLADEMELYSSDAARLGMAAMDAMRAARLVVDTGLHAFGWSRQQVVDYLRARTVMAEGDVQQEADRYVEYPGQALSYMVGRLELERLRARAEGELGAAFDVRAFHDAVLRSGPLPMEVLDTVVARELAIAAPGGG